MKILFLFGLLAFLGGTAMELREVENTKVNDYILVIEEKANEFGAEDTVMKLQTEQGIQEVGLEEYLIGVVLTEMPASFEQEALKAQAVTARTFAMRANKHEDFDLCTYPGCCQAWRSQSELKQSFGADFSAMIEKGKAAVQATEGEVIYYGDELIEAVYFSCSGGMSEPAVAVWGNDVPYLQAVESPGEEDSSKFHREVRFSFSEFRKRLENASPDAKFSVIPQDWIGEVTLSPGGGIATMDLAGVSFSGTELRSIFSLPSTKFSLTVEDGEMVFSAYGYGHRVGMSQYGANAMAKDGADYKEILLHYYTDVSIKKLSRK